MSEYLLNRCRKVPMYWICQLPYIRISNIIPKVDLQDDPSQIIGQISNDYLDSIFQLCNKYDISFKLVSAPVREDQCQKLEKLLAEEYPMKDTPLIKDYILSLGNTLSADEYRDICLFLEVPYGKFFDDGEVAA